MRTEIEQNEHKKERLARLALYLGLNLKAGAFHRILNHLGSAGAAFGCGRNDLAALGLNIKPLLFDGLLEEAVAEMESAAKSGLDILIVGDDHYPLRLDEIIDPPPVLWVKGRLEREDQWAVALVGSREASGAGRAAGRRLAREGAAFGLTIVSGLAKGVDGAAHQGALEAGGRTLGILGSGLNWVYPKENKYLFEMIPERGALISEFPPSTRPSPGYFPRRNRIIAGLSLAVVVVEARERSGALITARLALEMNREVMALPGQAGAGHTKGTNRLIKEGAALVENMGEVLAEIKPRLLEGLKPRPIPQALEPIENATALEVNHRGPADGDLAKRKGPEPKSIQAVPPEVFKDLKGTPKLIADQLSQGPCQVDTLIRGTGLSASEITEHLLFMELDGFIIRRPSGYYELLTGSTRK